MESYPDALDVALATHRQVSEGTITKPTLREGIPGLQQTSWWLKLLAKDLNTMLMEDTYFYIIDSHLWAKKKMGMLEIHVTKPTKNKKVLILSAAALSSIVTGEISYKNALELGVAKLK
ncbi:hypothetical protein OH460_25690 [Vibrio sp. Makdt]|uniref:hypothetical protein n=1 Tax=Vibrio sp. Makdt TaxID=2998828 RepID=UPI0022CD57C0|nr:hypothetical protein [Vibrio sp. Makdt]MDA0155716.1 hypothetical protein [Vibrio sp. Makdt]